MNHSDYDERFPAFAIYDEYAEVGKTIKKSKIRCTWIFAFKEDKDKEVRIQLAHSVMSGKKQVEVDGKEVVSVSTSSLAWSHAINLGRHMVRISIRDDILEIENMYSKLFILFYPATFRPSRSDVSLV